MKFAEPSWLIAGFLVIAALVFLYRVLDKRQRAALAEFASSHLLAKLTASFSPGRRMLKRGLFLAALACIFVALSRPQWGYHWVDQKERGIDLFFAIDTSKSMLTQDVNPDRLTRAKMAITDFVRKLDGDRVGLIAFAGESFLQAPLTLDYDAFQDSLDSIDTNTIPRGGTNIASAIQEAQVAFANNTQNKKILILVTDGEDLQGQGIDAARAAAKDGLVVYTVGVGTAAGGLVPVTTDGGGTDFVKDPTTGEFVKSHLDESTLTQIAEATGGMYQPLGQQGQGLGVIYDKALASLPKHDLAARRTRVYEERFQWPLSAGLVLLFASVLIGTRRRTVRPAAPEAAPFRVTKKMAALVALSLLIAPTMAHASAQSAEGAYKKGDYNNAEAQYQDAAAAHPDDAPLQYDLGAAAYKSGEFDTALPAFQKALGSDDPALQQQSYYNIGNTQYRIGQKTAKSSPQDTIKQWQQAVEAYDGALKLKPDDGDAKFNRDYVQKKLDELEKQQKQNQKQDQKDQKQQQNKQNQNQQQQQNQNQQNQQQNQQQQNQQGQSQQQNQDQQQQNQQQSGSKGGQGNQQDQQQPQNGQNQAQNGGQQQNQNGQQQQQQQSAGNQNQDQNKSQNGQQQQQTAGNQDQKQNQGPNGQQQQQTAGNQDQKQNQGQNGQPQNQQQNGNGGNQQQQQTAQNKPANGGSTGQAATASADKDKQSGDQTADVALPEGQLTKEQAKDLLNSLKGEEHILPVAQDTRSTKPQDQQVLKDW